MEFKSLGIKDTPALWKINEEGLPGTGEISLDAMSDLLSLGEFCIGAFEEEKLLGFVICLLPNRSYGSLNYAWFNDNYANFLYVDRIAVSEEYRNKTSKKIHSGHRREKTLKEMKMTHFPIKYVSVQKHDNPYDNIISLMTENQTRDRSAYQKYQSVVSLNKEYFKKEGVQPAKETITMHCALSTTNIVTFNNAEKIRTRNPELWKRVESGKISLSGAVDKFNNKPKEKNRHMSPNTLSIVTTDRINRTLRLTQLMMTQYNNISVPDPLNPNEDWKPTKEFQKQTALKGWTSLYSAALNPFYIAGNAKNRRQHKRTLQELEGKNFRAGF